MGFTASDSQRVTGPNGEDLGTMGIAFTTSPGGRPSSETRNELVAQEAQRRLTAIEQAKKGDKKAVKEVQQWGLGRLLVILLGVGVAIAGVRQMQENNPAEPIATAPTEDQE